MTTPLKTAPAYEVWDLNTDSSRVTDGIEEARRIAADIREENHKAAIVEWMGDESRLVELS